MADILHRARNDRNTFVRYFTVPLPVPRCGEKNKKSVLQYGVAFHLQEALRAALNKKKSGL
jgi:hypothetical protein